MIEQVFNNLAEANVDRQCQKIRKILKQKYQRQVVVNKKIKIR